MIKKTYIPAKPRSQKLVPSTQKSYDRIISSLSEQVNKPQPQIDPRVSELKSYLEVVNTDLARLTETYNTINDSTVIGTMVKTQLTGLKDNLDASADAFITYATDALSDGVLTEEEIEEIDTRKEAYLTAFGAFMAFAEPISISLIKVNILKDDLMKYAREKAQIDSVYPGIYDHPYLMGAAKTAYYNAKAAYDLSYTDLIDKINIAIADGKATTAELAAVQISLTEYGNAYAAYKQAEDDAKWAIDYITGLSEKQRTYDADKARADSTYLYVYNNIYLVGDDKNDYLNAKNAYNTAYSNVISGIGSIFIAGTLTPAEITEMNSLISIYLDKLNLLILAEETAREAIGEEQKRQAQVYAESLFDDVVETQTALENSLLKYSESINPITAQMMQLIVGDESLQFHFVESKVNPVRVSHSVSYLSGTLTVYAGWIKHLTLGITDISPAHEYKFWNVPLSAFGSLDPDKYYYLYAKCSTSAETGEYILSETPVEIDGVSGYYHLLMGILNSENNLTRRFATLYGFTEVLPGRITVDKIVSQDGETYIDLITGEGQFGGGVVVWDSEGNAYFSGKVESSSDGNRVIIDPDDKSVKLIDYNDETLSNIGFKEVTEGDQTFNQPYIEQLSPSVYSFTPKSFFRPSYIELTNVTGFQNTSFVFDAKNSQIILGLSGSSPGTLKINIKNLPTSGSGLSAGDLYRDSSGYLKTV